MRLVAAAACVALALGSSAHAAVNLVKNGDFESYTLTSAQQAQTAGYVGFQVTYPDGSYANAVDHWTSAQGGAYPAAYNLYFYNAATAQGGDAFSQYGGEQQRPNVNFSGAAPAGPAFMILDGDPNFTGPLSQLVTGLTVGKTYTLGFWWAGGELSNRTGYNTIQLTGTFGSDGFATSVFNNTKPSGVPGDFSGWQHVTKTFKAASNSQVLSFLAVGTPAANLPPVAFLDGVSLTAVPEPASWAIMILGFGALGAAARRRRAQAAAV